MGPLTLPTGMVLFTSTPMAIIYSVERVEPYHDVARTRCGKQAQGRPSSTVASSEHHVALETLVIRPLREGDDGCLEMLLRSILRCA